MELSILFEKAAADIKLLHHDIQAIKDAKNTDTVASKKSLQPRTRLRDNRQELIEAQKEDPDIQFIYDKIKDILE